MEETKKVSEEQGGFRKGKGCMDQIIAIKIVVEDYLRKVIKVYTSFMDQKRERERERERLIVKVFGIFQKFMVCERAVIRRIPSNNSPPFYRGILEAGSCLTVVEEEAFLWKQK